MPVRRKVSTAKEKRELEMVAVRCVTAENLVRRSNTKVGGIENTDGGNVRSRRDGDENTEPDAEDEERRSRGRWSASGGTKTPAAKGLSGAEKNVVRCGLDNCAWERSLLRHSVNLDTNLIKPEI
ncbi:hypothetical protein Rs2_05242 [Raphanus sativus]|nr:hypothetical protein Rs2_05242 [Raphanus sativus]